MVPDLNIHSSTVINMQLLIIASLLGCAISAPAGGFGTSHAPAPVIHGSGGYGGGGGGGGGVIAGPILSGGRGYGDDVVVAGGGGGHGGGYGHPCGQGEVRHVDGSCVRPQVSRNVFVYSAPNLPVSYAPVPPIPRPKVNYNVVFVRTPERPYDPDPIVVPPAQQRTLVYVLTKNGQVGQRVIEVPGNDNEPPQVFYVNYDEGDQDTVLPGGISLQEALNSAVTRDGQLVGGGGGGAIVGGGVGDGYGAGGGGVVIAGGGDGYGGGTSHY